MSLAPWLAKFPKWRLAFQWENHGELSCHVDSLRVHYNTSDALPSTKHFWIILPENPENWCLCESFEHWPRITKIDCHFQSSASNHWTPGDAWLKPTIEFRPNDQAHPAHPGVLHSLSESAWVNAGKVSRAPERVAQIHHKMMAVQRRTYGEKTHRTWRYFLGTW